MGAIEGVIAVCAPNEEARCKRALGVPGADSMKKGVSYVE